MLRKASGKLNFSKKLTMQIKNSFISSSKKFGDDLILIRHAESEFNTACEDYRRAHNIPYVWKQLCNHQGFDQKVLFNLKYIDCRITSFGKSQCLKQKKKLKNQKIDCILVSPQIRALQTCNTIFKEKNIPTIVQPLLVGPLRSCSDINKSTQDKIKQFPHFNFSNTKNYQQLWYLDYLPKEQRQICYDRFLKKRLFTNDQKRAELLQLLKEGRIYEDAFHYRQRIEKLKQKLLEYRSIYQRIAIVSHYYTIQYLTAVEYQKCGAPITTIDIKNCSPYYCSTKNFAQKECEEVQKIICTD